MSKPSIQQSLLDPEIFEQPVAIKKTRKPRGAPKPPEDRSPPAKQAFLPGLSRRGRPRKKDAPSPVVRASESRKRREAAGAKRCEIFLDPEIAAMLDDLCAHHKLVRGELIARLVKRAGQQLQRKMVKAATP